MTRNLGPALVLPVLSMIAGCGVAVRSAGKGIHQAHSAATQLTEESAGRHGQLSSEQKQWARSAWKYFEANLSPATGVVEANEGTAEVTMWSVADYIAATCIARDLHLITETDARLRLRAVLQFLNSMELFQGRVPNQRYGLSTGKKIDAQGQAGETGWSTVDMGRLLIWLKFVGKHYPLLSPFATDAVERWDLCDVVTPEGGLQSGGWAADGTIQRYEEGNAGYQEYASAGYAMWGFNVAGAASVKPSEDEKIDGVVLARDAADPRITGHLSPVETLPSVLEGIETGWTSPYAQDGGLGERELAARVLQVQEERYRRAHVLTARSSHAIPEPPYAVYDSIFVDGYPWNTVTASGVYKPEYATVSTASALGLWVLWPGPYTDLLAREVRDAATTDRGWYEGVVEKGGGLLKARTSTTNAVVLEILDYYVHGPRFGAADFQVTDEVKRAAQRSSTCKKPGPA